jgi:hypothetical protein
MRRLINLEKGKGKKRTALLFGPNKISHQNMVQVYERSTDIKYNHSRHALADEQLLLVLLAKIGA